MNIRKLWTLLTRFNTYEFLHQPQWVPNFKTQNKPHPHKQLTPVVQLEEPLETRFLDTANFRMLFFTKICLAFMHPSTLLRIFLNQNPTHGSYHNKIITGTFWPNDEQEYSSFAKSKPHWVNSWNVNEMQLILVAVTASVVKGFNFLM